MVPREMVVPARDDDVGQCYYYCFPSGKKSYFRAAEQLNVEINDSTRSQEASEA